MISKIWIILICALPLAACAKNAPIPCAGWQKAPKVNNAARMVSEEPELSRWVITTDRFGRKQGCWQ